MLFFFISCIVAPYIGRKLGWALSRRLFYSTPSGIAVPLCLLWGLALAFGFRHLVTALNPNIILAVLGFMAGGYIFDSRLWHGRRMDVPARLRYTPRHRFKFSLPLVHYCFCCISLRHQVNTSASGTSKRELSVCSWHTKIALDRR